MTALHHISVLQKNVDSCNCHIIMCVTVVSVSGGDKSIIAAGGKGSTSAAGGKGSTSAAGGKGSTSAAGGKGSIIVTGGHYSRETVHHHHHYGPASDQLEGEPV